MEPQNALMDVGDGKLGTLQNDFGSGEMGKSGCKWIFPHFVPFGSLAYQTKSD